MHLKVTIKEISDTAATLRFEDGETVLWPVSKLPKEIKVQDILNIRINDDGNAQEPEQLAKDLLNEILNIE